MALETRTLNHSRDGDGGEYWMELDLDVLANGRETLLRVRIVNQRTAYPVNYWVKSPGGGVLVDSTAGDPQYPPVGPGQTLVRPEASTYNLRIDNRQDFTTGLY